MNGSKLKVIVLEPGKLARVAEIESTLVAMEGVVQGDIEVIYPFDDPVCIVCNDSGKADHLPLCRVLFDADRKIIDIICGSAFLCGFDDEGFCSLNVEQIEKYMSRFRYPERLPSWESERRGFRES